MGVPPAGCLLLVTAAAFRAHLRNPTLLPCQKTARWHLPELFSALLLRGVASGVSFPQSSSRCTNTQQIPRYVLLPVAGGMCLVTKCKSVPSHHLTHGHLDPNLAHTNSQDPFAVPKVRCPPSTSFSEMLFSTLQDKAT